MADLCVIADIEVHAEILSDLLEITFSALRTDETILRMSCKDQLQDISARLQDLRGRRLNDHALSDRGAAGSRKKSLSFHLHHADAADRLNAQVLMVT